MTRQESLARKKRRFQILFVVVHYGNWHRQQQLLQDKKAHRHRPRHASSSNTDHEDETQADAIARIYSSLCRDAVTYALQRGMEDEYDATCEF